MFITDTNLVKNLNFGYDTTEEFLKAYYKSDSGIELVFCT